MSVGSSLGVTLAWLSCALAVQAQASGEPGARYARALANELNALGFVAQCNQPSPTSFACTYPARSAIDKQNLTAHAHYDDTTDTVYVYVPVLSIAENSAALPGLLRRAMELNWELLSAKLEWNAQAGELRVSSVLHTDSNFDRRAFRSLVRSLDRVILQHYVELTSLAAAGGSPL
jgi:hypothetical protein